MDSSDDAIVSITLDGIIASWNAAAESMFGYKAAEAIGHSTNLIIPPEHRASENVVLDRIQSGEKVDHFETVRQTKDGRRLNISLAVSPIRNAAGEVAGASEIARDISDRKRLESLLTAIVTSSSDAIVSKTLEGIVTSWNPSAERMFGYAAAEMIGKSIRLIIPPERQAEEDYVLSKIRSGETVDHFETIRQSKDGRRLNISLTVSPIVGPDGVVIGASKIARDITEKKQLEREQEVVREQLAEALAGRDEFIAIAAHELRNPLNVLTLLWRLIDRTSRVPGGTVDPTLIEKSRAQLARLSLLVDRLLDVTRIRAGTFDLYRENFELCGLIREVTGRFSIENPAISISLELEPQIEGTWDRLRVDQVITNLVSNAIRYGMQRPIQISASTGAGQAVVIVKDHGIGISAENLQRIFERFERAEPRSSNHGLGMGLWITKQIVEAHRGTVQVQSAPGKGSTFTVRLPVDE